MPVVRYTVIDGSLVAEKRDGIRSLYVPDSLGSTVALLDNTQTQTDQWSYMPYGEATRVKGTNPTPYLYGGESGMRTDSAGRIYARARVVEPPKARFMTEDPIGFRGGGYNLYEYGSGNPTTVRDPSGLSWCCIGFIKLCCKAEDPIKKCHKSWVGLVKKLQPIWAPGAPHGDKDLCDAACPEIKKWLSDLTNLCGADLMINVPVDYCHVILWFEHFCSYSRSLGEKLEPFANGCSSGARQMPPGDPPKGWDGSSKKMS